MEVFPWSTKNSTCTPKVNRFIMNINMQSQEVTTLSSSVIPRACFGVVSLKLQSVRHRLNDLFCYEPVILIGTTAIAVHLVHHFYHKIPKDGVKSGLKRWFFRNARKLPFIKKKILTELEKTKKALNADMLKLMRGKNSEEFEYILTVPAHGVECDAILSKLKQYMELGAYSWQNGCVSGTVYHGGDELTQLNTEVFRITAWTNPLHSDVFPGSCKMEAEIVRMVSNLFHGSPNTSGTVTSGGTESIILAVKAYRDYAIQEKGIQYPEILVPITAHAAFDKAAQLLNIKIKHVPINLNTCQVDIKKMKKMITANTCMLVGSTPAFPHGCMDDIEKIAELGLYYNIPVHVDACLGGFLIAFMPGAGFPIPPFDFTLSGVTSISADTHKYGFAPKGSSVLVFRSIDYKHKQYFLQSDWPGGLYGSPTLAGSRSGAVIAGCWASMLYFGLEGYLDSTKRIITATRKIVAGLRKIQGIKVMGDPLVSVVAFTSNTFDIYQLSENLNKRGWCLNNLQFPPSIHICLTYCQTADGVVERFVSDVAEEVACLLKNPNLKVSESVALYGSAAKIPDRSLIQEITAMYLDSFYSTEVDVPPTLLIKHREK